MINFAEDTHKYWIEVEGAEMVVPSVSTIISHILELDYSGIDPFYADRGTAVHKAIELLIEDNLDEESLDEDGVKDGDLVDVDKKEEKVSSLVDIDLHSKDAEQNESSEETDDEGERVRDCFCLH